VDFFISSNFGQFECQGSVRNFRQPFVDRLHKHMDFSGPILITDRINAQILVLLETVEEYNKLIIKQEFVH